MKVNIKSLINSMGHADEWLPIFYSGFWDVPDAFLTEYNGDLFLFWRDSFDEEIDDYPPNYKVYSVRNVTLKEAYELHEEPFEFVRFLNTPLLLENEIIGEVPTKEVCFYYTNRKFVNSRVFKQLSKN